MSNLIQTALGGEPADGDRIEASPLKFSSIAAFLSGLAALAAAIPSILDALNVSNLTDTQLIGAMALLAAGVIGFAIASAGDALARAYSAAWVVPMAGDVGAHPALLELAASVREHGVRNDSPDLNGAAATLDTPLGPLTLTPTGLKQLLDAQAPPV